MNDQQGHSGNTQKAVRLVDYLTRLASLRSKLIRDLSEYEKVLWISDIPCEHGCFTRAWGRDEEHEPDEWLEVQNRQEPKLPTVPDQCQEWIDETSLRNKDDFPELLPAITRQIQNPDWYEDSDQPETIPVMEHLEQHPSVQQAWDQYVEGKWWPWAKEHNVWEKIHRVYSALFAIHQAQLRLGEEYELVLGLGLLTWQSPNGQSIRRHLVVADAILEFEARLGKFVVRPHTEGAKLRPELDMLDIEEQPPRAEETARSSLAETEDPWEKGSVEGVLQALVHSINSEGVYLDELDAKGTRASTKPIVEYAPAVILRRRSDKGLTESLKRIKEDIESGEDIPSEFADLAEIRKQDDPELGDGREKSQAKFDGEIYFPKPSNDEQRGIIDKMSSANGVLVQGPPGTGKSHTIANLICHLLATGQRTLITAKTPRALRVLEGLVPDELRPLCINLLGSDLEERRSLESSIGGILRASQEWNEGRAEEQRIDFENHLRELREEKATVNRHLRDIREAETHSQSIAEGTYQGTAARIAQSVNRDRSVYDWFTDTISTDKPCPISTSNLQKILDALRYFTPEKRHEMSLTWPDAMPSSEHFAQLVEDEAKAAGTERDCLVKADERIANVLARSDPAIIEEILSAVSAFHDTRRRLTATSHLWINDALRDILNGNSSLWHELYRVTEHVISTVETLVVVADETTVEFPDATDIKTLYEDARKLKKYIERGGRLGWGLFRPKPVKERLHVIRSVKVSGRSCSTVEQLSTLADVLHVRIEIEKAWGFWAGRSDRAQGPYALQLSALKSLRDALANALSLQDALTRCRDAIQKCPPLDEPSWDDESQVERTIYSCRLGLARINKHHILGKIQCVESPVSRIVAEDNAHPVANELLNAIRNRDREEFAQCGSKIDELEKQRKYLRRLEEYLPKLRRLLPHFTDDLEHTCSEPYWEERIQRIGEAWHWAQARYWIEDYIRQEDVPALAKRANQIENEINDVVAKLASLLAWSFCFSPESPKRIEERHRRHMEAWQQSIRRLGKGTGKHAPRHRREAQGHLSECREAVPAWIMPLHRVWDTVYPTPGMFDVVIVDEASQCGVEALPLFYLGKKILIVGDDKQISPDAVGLPRDAVHRLTEEFLHDFHFKDSFGVESSLFDHGRLRYGTHRVALREHFRCMPEIIRFSNDLCYTDSPLVPLRQYGPDRLPPLEHILVREGYREGSNNRTINRPEADAIVARVTELCGDSRYDGKSIGVVVLQGEAQAALIESQLLERLGAEEMERRRLVCGNPYSFQGDERDIIFLSLVAATNKRIGALTKAADERRFNVATSRACDQLTLFHSVTREDLSTVCLRRKLLEFFEEKSQRVAGIERDELELRVAQDNRAIVSPPAPFESWFEVDVALELLRKGFSLIPQHEVAGKRIDLVVEGGQARLGVECDGDHWHGVDRYEADMQRQRQLERCGWEFFRVRESAFYANKEDALAGLWEKLEERGIFATSLRTDSTSDADPEEGDWGQSAGNGVAGNDSVDDDEDGSPYESEDGSIPSGRRAEEITAAEIQDAILQVLSGRPNQSCTLHSLTSRVLREVGVLTRGKPWKKFEKRTMQCVGKLEKHGRVETYQATNRRVRLVPKGKT